MYKLAYTDRFKKAFNNLTNNEQIQFQNKMKLFVENVLHPSLRTKKIKGQKDLYESSINMDIRIIWYFENEELIILVDIGHHDILKEFWKRLIVPHTYIKDRYRSSYTLEEINNEINR